MKRPVREDRWIGSAQVLVDYNGHVRAVLTQESENQFLVIGPIDTVDPCEQIRGKNEWKLKRTMERDLRKAGYLR